MKKFALMMCLLSLLASTTFTVFAQDNVNEPGKYLSQDLIMKYTYIEGQVVLSADVTWEDLSFRYVAQGDKGAWDPTNHTYSENTLTGQFDPIEEKVITITNHSNSAINIVAIAESANGTTATVSLDTTAADLPSSNNINFKGDKINDNKKEIKVTMNGEISDKEDGETVANVVVTISEKPKN